MQVVHYHVDPPVYRVARLHADRKELQGFYVRLGVHCLLVRVFGPWEYEFTGNQ